MAETYSLSIKLGVLDKSSGPLRKVAQNLSNIGRRVERLKGRMAAMSATMKATGNKMAGIGKKMSMTLTAPIVAFGALAIKSIVGFDDAMNKLGAVSLTTEGKLAQMRETAKHLGATTRFSASEAAQGMTFLKMAGLEVNEVISVIPGTLKLATAGNLDLATAADIATNVLLSFSMRSKDAAQTATNLARVNDVLALAQSKANTNILQLSEAFQTVGGTADSLGFSLEETTALLGKMADVGSKGGIAGTLLRNAMMRLVNITPKAANAFKKMGIDVSKFITESGKIQNFTGLITEMKEKGAKTGDIMKAFGERGGRAMISLLKSGGPAIDKLKEKLDNAGGSTDKMTEIMERGLPGALRALKSAFEAFQIALGEAGFTGMVRTAAKALTGFFRNMSTAQKSMLKWGIIIAGVIAVIGPLVMAIGGITIALGFLAANPIVLIIAAIVIAIGILTIAIYKNREIIIGWAKSLGDFFINKINTAIRGIYKMLNAMIKVRNKIAGFMGFGEKELLIVPQFKTFELKAKQAKFAAIRTAASEGEFGRDLAKMNIRAKSLDRLEEEQKLKREEDARIDKEINSLMFVKQKSETLIELTMPEGMTGEVKSQKGDKGTKVKIPSVSSRGRNLVSAHAHSH